MKTSKELWQAYNLKVTFLGVLWTMVKIDKSVPDGLIEKYLINHLTPIDQALLALNLDGLMHFDHMTYAEDDINRYVLAKFVPNMPHWNWRYLLMSAALGTLIYWLFVRFGVWPQYIKPIIDRWTP